MNPGPTNVDQSVKSALCGRDMSHRAPGFRHAVTDLIRLVREGLNCTTSHDVAAFVSSGTGANEAMLAAIEGPVLIIDRGRYSRRLIDISNRLGLSVSVLEGDPYVPLEPDELDVALKSNPDIRNVVLVHLETSTGVMLPLAGLCEVASRRNVAVYVDAISSVGGHEFDLAKLDIEMATLTPNKCLEGVPGIAFVAVKKSAPCVSQKSYKSRSFYFDIGEQIRKSRDGVMPYTASVPVILSAREAANRWLAEGVDQRISRYAATAAYLRRRLGEIGIDICHGPPCSSNILTIFNLGAINYPELVNYMLDRDIELYTPSSLLGDGRAFFATMGSIGHDDIDDFIEELTFYMRNERR